MFETLERRRLMATYSASDYFPLGPIDNWDYAGQTDGQDTTDVVFITSATVNGVPVKKLTDEENQASVPSTEDFSYVTTEAGDIQEVQDSGSDFVFNYEDPLPEIPATFSDGQVFTSDNRRVNIVDPTDSSSPPFTGTYNTTITVGGPEVLHFNWLYFGNAIKLTRSMSLSATSTQDGITATIQASGVDNYWLVRGIGPVQESDDGDITVSATNGYQDQNHTSSTSFLTGSSLLPRVSTYDGHTLSVPGTSGDDTISVTSTSSTSEGLMSVVNGVGEAISASSKVAVVFVPAGAGNDSITIGTGVPGALVRGGTGNDTIVGGDGNDTLVGGQDNDLIHGGAGDDLLRGGPGDDAVAGSLGNDQISGGTGNDVLRGGQGSDTVDGGDGDDLMFGGPSQDLLTGGSGNDTINAQDGSADTVDGGDGMNVATSDPELDVLTNVLS
jgi:Ca2+-binding RTX toxin-like protein